ncbi:MAG: N-acyl-L-amino acid amidohydrolase [Bacteroidetes bacterium]|nr:MAG: N-acyl-L-amino acid amidohydrolase [Bacteroidota bacterium]
MEIKDKIKQLASEYRSEIIAIRNEIHANPELSFEEYNTSKYVASILNKSNINYESGLLKTGLLASIEGKSTEGKTIALRAELDALPIFEENNVPYKSKNEGIMHACGHDVHMASILGAAKILNEISDEWNGKVKVLFQPGEEKLPGGAAQMIEGGIIEKMDATCMMAHHVMPTIDAGKVGFRAGMYMASADEIFITVKGKGGHAALPKLNIDPIPIAAEIILAMQKITPEDEEIPMVLSIGKVTAAGATNVIPNHVEMEGTFRTMNEDWRAKAHELIEKTCVDIASAHNASCEIEIKKGYPFLQNDVTLTAESKNLAIEYLGADNVEDLELRMTADDFASFSQHMTTCYYRLGIRNESKGITSGVHTPTFDIDEQALETGMGLIAWLVYSQLAKV